MEALLLALDAATKALATARLLYEAYDKLDNAWNENDQAKLKTRLAELQEEYDSIHERVQDKLRG